MNVHYRGMGPRQHMGDTTSDYIFHYIIIGTIIYKGGGRERSHRRCGWVSMWLASSSPLMWLASTQQGLTWHASPWPSPWLVLLSASSYVKLDTDVASVNVAYVFLPPSFHATSSSCHLLLVLLFSCPVIVGECGGRRCGEVDVAGVDVAASTCRGRNQRGVVDVDLAGVDVVCGMWTMTWCVVGGCGVVNMASVDVA